MAKKIHSALYTLSSILLVLALALLIVFELNWAKYLLLAGGMGYLFSVVWFRPQENGNLRIRRLIRMAHFSGILWVAGAFAIIWKSQLWIIFCSIACIFMLYSNITLSINLSKKQNQNDQEY